MKYISFDEAMLALTQGKKVAGEDWADGEYIYFDRFNSRDVLDENGEQVFANTLIINIDCDWFIIPDAKEEN